MRRRRLRIFSSERRRQLDGAFRREMELRPGSPFRVELRLDPCVRLLQRGSRLAFADEPGRALLMHRRRLRKFPRQPRR
jgi:hypothetical protein